MKTKTFKEVKKTVDGYEIYPLPNTLDGYASIVGNTLWLSAIHSKKEGKGNFRLFLDEVEKKFKIIKVPTPSNRMFDILTKRGYVLKQENFGEPLNEVGEVMVKETKII